MAPKKANWDLRRDIAGKLAKLERRTQVRARLAHTTRKQGKTTAEEVGPRASCIVYCQSPMLLPPRATLAGGDDQAHAAGRGSAPAGGASWRMVGLTATAAALQAPTAATSVFAAARFSLPCALRLSITFFQCTST